VRCGYTRVITTRKRCDAGIGPNVDTASKACAHDPELVARQGTRCAHTIKRDADAVPVFRTAGDFD
jgi:hypothetical protein